MKKSILTSMILLLSTLVLRQGSVAQGGVDIDLFYSSLAPYGTWFEYGNYGLCWRPTVVGVGWRPYTHGHWVWTDYGWTWVSHFEWGWAPFHYGRWIYDGYYGWIWVPDYIWGPAWVEWRVSDSYIGWAPLPPAARFSFSVGFSIGSYSIPHFGWSFTHCTSFLAPRVILLPVRRNAIILRQTRFVTGIRAWGQRRVYNEGPPRDFVERATGTRLRQVTVVESRDFGRTRGNRLEGDRLYIYRPEVDRPREGLREDSRGRIFRGREEFERPRNLEKRDLHEQRPDDSRLPTRGGREGERKIREYERKGTQGEPIAVPKIDRERPTRMEQGQRERRLEPRDAGRSRPESPDRSQRRGRER